MATMYYGGDNMNAGYYSPQQGYSAQNYNMASNYSNFVPQNFNHGYYNQNYTSPSAHAFNPMNNNQPAVPFQNNFNTNTNYPNPQFYQQQSNNDQMQNSMQRPKSAPQQNRYIDNQPRPQDDVEIRGGVKRSTCHCAKKNGLQDNCGKSVCRVVNEEKRRRRLCTEIPTRDVSNYNPSGDANNLIVNPAYFESLDNQIVPSNAQPVPVAHYNNYQM